MCFWKELYLISLSQNQESFLEVPAASILAPSGSFPSMLEACVKNRDLEFNSLHARVLNVGSKS